nr:hypothetical protein [Flavobacteriales bacterium]
MKNLKFICSVLVSCSLFMVKAQAPQIDWEKNYGGSQFDGFFDMIPTTDGGYLISGFSYSNNGDVDVSYGGGDIWLLKTDVSGAIQWQKTFGGSGYDIAEKILQTTDGGYILAGTTDSSDGDVANNYGQTDVWIIKINASGDLQWEKNYGGQSNESARNILATPDGGYLIIADTDSADNDVSV